MTILWIVAGLVAFFALWWWLEVGSARRDWRKANEEVAAQFAMVAGSPYWRRPLPPTARRDNDAGISAGDRKLTEGRELEARTQAQAAKLEAFACGIGPTDAIPRITEVPSTNAHESVQAIYRALSRGNNREAQALARYYLHAKHAAGVPVAGKTSDGTRNNAVGKDRANDV